MVKVKTNHPSQNAGFQPCLIKCSKKIGESRIKSNIRSGFRKCGIYRFNPHNVYSRLPKGSYNTTVIENSINDVLIDYLRNARYSSHNASQRKKKVNVPPGKSVSREDLLCYTQEPPAQLEPPNLVASSTQRGQRGCPKKKPASQGVSQSEGVAELNSTREPSPQPGPSNADTQHKRQVCPKKQRKRLSAQKRPIKDVDTTNNFGKRGRPKMKPPTQLVVTLRRNARRLCRRDPIVESENSEPFSASDSD